MIGALGHQALSIRRKKPLEQIGAVVRARRGFRVILHREHRPIAYAQTLERAIEQRQVRLLDLRRQAVRADREAMVLAGDLHLAGGQILDRMVGAVMPELHLLGGAAERQRQHLMTQADAEQRLAARQELLDLRHREPPGRRRIARAVRQEDAVRLERQDLLGRGGRRHHRHPQVEAGERAEDVALDSIIDGDHMMPAVLEATVAVRIAPDGFVPRVALTAGNLGCEVHALHARRRARHLRQLRQVRIPVAGEAQGGGLGAGIAQAAGDAPRVDPGDPDQAARLEPAIEMLRGAEVRGLGDRRPQHDAAGVAVGGFDIFGVGADVADVRKGEGDQLAGVGRIGQDLLVAGHGRVEHELADHGAGRSQPLAEKRRAVGEHEGGPGAAAVGWRSWKERLVTCKR